MNEMRIVLANLESASLLDESYFVTSCKEVDLGYFKGIDLNKRGTR